MRYGPSPDTMNRGVPPTPPNARTGELTPPGVTTHARAYSSALRVAGIGIRAIQPAPRNDGTRHRCGAGSRQLGEQSARDRVLRVLGRVLHTFGCVLHLA